MSDATSLSADQPREPMSLARTALGFFAMIFGMFMAILDIQIVSASIPQIQAGLSASRSEVAWVQSSYLIAEVIMIPLSGYLSRLLSTRVLFAASAASFTVMSILCSTATTIDQMIVYRALQGFLGGAMIPTTFTAIYSAFPREHQPTANVVAGLVITLAPTIGPTLGGYLTDLGSWHWLFLINVIPGTAATIIVWNVMRIDEADWSLARSFDFIALGLMAAFLGSLEFVLEEGPGNDWFEDPEIRFFAVVGVVGGILFFWRTLTSQRPIVDLSVFRDRNFTVGSMFGFALGIVLFGITAILPLYLAQVKGYSSLQVGETLWVTGCSMFVTAPIAGFLARRYDPRLTMLLGFTLLGLACYFFTGLTTETGYWDLFIPQVCRGTGLMCCMVPINMVALGQLPPLQLKAASGLFTLLRNTGGAVGLAVLNTQLIDRSHMHWLRVGESLPAGNPKVEAFLDGFSGRYGDLLPGGDPEQGSLRILEYLMRQQAEVLAYNDIFLMLMIMIITVSLFIIFVQRPRAMTSGGH